MTQPNPLKTQIFDPFPTQPNPTQPNPTQPNPRVNPTRGQLWVEYDNTHHLRGDAEGQENKVKSSVWLMVAHNSTTKSRRNFKIDRKVVRATADTLH